MCNPLYRELDGFNQVDRVIVTARQRLNIGHIFMILLKRIQSELNLSI